MAFQQSSRANGSVMALARGLGWFSIGLGLAEMLAPRMLGNQLGMEGKESLLRFYGAREMAAGVGILMSDNPGPWIWGRVAGDALDLASDPTDPRVLYVSIAGHGVFVSTDMGEHWAPTGGAQPNKKSPDSCERPVAPRVGRHQRSRSAAGRNGR